MTEKQLADLINSGRSGRDRVSQSWISRISNGGFKRNSRQVSAVLDYTDIRFSALNKKDPVGRETIERAIDEVWDGTAENARVIAQLLRSAGALVRQRS